MNEIIHNLVDEFLSKHREAHKGWAEVTQEDINDLSEIIGLLITYKCDADSDGDRPIEFKLVNRREGYLPSFWPMPYWWMIQNPSWTSPEYRKAFKIAIFNLETAMEIVQSMQRSICE